MTLLNFFKPTPKPSTLKRQRSGEGVLPRNVCIESSEILTVAESPLVVNASTLSTHWPAKRQQLRSQLQGTSFVRAADGDLMVQVEKAAAVKAAISERTLQQTSATKSIKQPADTVVELPSLEDYVAVDAVALAMVRTLLRLLLSPQSPIQACKEIRTLEKRYTDDCRGTDKDPIELLALNVIRHWVPGAWEFVTSNMRANTLPKYQSQDWR